MTDDLLAIADRILGLGYDDEQIEVIVVHERATEIRAYDGDIESLSSSESQGVGIRVIKDHRQGFASAGTFDSDVVAETLIDARDNATFGTPDEFLGLAEPDDVPVPELSLVDEELDSFAAERKVEMAIELERAVRAADSRIIGVESADYVDAMGRAAVVSTTGIRALSAETAAYLMAYPLASDGDDTQTGFGFSVGKGPAALDVASAANDAVNRATRLLGATKPKSERLTVVLDPFVTAQFLEIIGSILTGDAVQKGRSLFADRLGDSVASPTITLVDDPTNPDAFSATESDGEGLAARCNPLISDGVLNRFLHNAYTARKGKTTSTGSAVRDYASTPAVGCQALALVPGVSSQSELIAGIDNGLLVQGVSGLHSGVNPVSGDFSTGAEGIRISNGSLAEPLREFTIASTLQRMLLDVTAVGSDLEWLPMSAAGVSLVVTDVTVSGA